MKKIIAFILALALVTPFSFVGSAGVAHALFQYDVVQEDVPESVDTDALPDLIQYGRESIQARLDSLYYLRKATVQFPRDIKQTPQGKAYGFTRKQVTSLLRMIGPQIVSMKRLDRKIKFAQSEDVAREYIYDLFEKHRILSIFIPQYSFTEGLYKMQNRLAQVRDTLNEWGTLARHQATLDALSQKIQDALTKVSALSPADYDVDYDVTLQEVADALNEIQQGLDALLQ